MTTISVSRARTQNDRVFYTGMALAMAATVFAGFAPTYFLKSYFNGAPVNILLHAHGAAFTAWLLLFCSQTVLIAARRTDIHRKLGVIGGILAVIMLVLGIWASIGAIRTNHTPPGIDPRSFLILPFGDIATFIIFVGIGIMYRHRPETHKRLMLLATIAMLDAAIAAPAGPVRSGTSRLFRNPGPVHCGRCHLRPRNAPAG